MTDYLAKYGKGVKKFQAGGEVAASADPSQAAAPQGGQDIQSMIMQAYQAQDPNMALQVINMIVEQMQASQGGEQGAQPTPAASKGMRLNTPVFAKGGKLKLV